MTSLTPWRRALRLLVPSLASASAVIGVSLAARTGANAAPPLAPVAANVVAAEGDYGTISGKLVWGGATAPEPKVLREKGKSDKDPAVCAKDESIMDQELVVDPKTKGVKFGFAYIVKPVGSNDEAYKAIAEKHPKVELDQKNCAYSPFAIGMTQEQELILKSSDPVNHNVHLTAFTNEPFNTILPPLGTMAKKLVAEKRVLKMACDIHPWMLSYIMVFDHPFFAVTEADGSFKIHGVPPGTQKLVILQPKTGYATPGAGSGMPVTVVAGKTTDVGEVKVDPAKVK